MKSIENDYPLIPMGEITDEARILAVRWGDNMKDDFITQKHKLASDIMNYARRYYESEIESAKVFTPQKIREKLLELNPQIIPDSLYTNPFLYENTQEWYNELAK